MGMNVGIDTEVTVCDRPRMPAADMLDDAYVEPVEELRALAYRLTSVDAVAAEAVHSVLGSLIAPIELAVAGRAGVGRSAIARLLDADGWFSAGVGGAPVVVTETRAFDAPDTSDPDLGQRCVVYVVVDAVREADRRAIARVSERAVVAANKADLFRDRWDAATGRAAEIAEAVGVHTVPLVALTGRGTDELFAALTPLLEAQWWERVERIGPALARAASRNVAGRDEIEEYLGSDSAVLFSAAAALMRGDVRAVLRYAPECPCTAEDALECARWWAGRATEEPDLRQASVLIRRGYLRRWALLGGDAAAPVTRGE